jgi:hypothetical protein
MSRPLVDARTVAVGFLVALAVLAALGAVVGVAPVVAALADADSTAVLAALAATAVWLCAWGTSLFVALRTLDAPVCLPRAILVYASATFFNGLTPFAQVGGEALSAAVLSRSTDVEYETGLAAITAVDVVNLLPSPAFAVVAGVSLVVAGHEVPDVPLLATAAVGVLGVTIVTGLLVHHFRPGADRTLARIGVRAVVAATRTAARLLSLDASGLSRRVDSFLRGVRRVFGRRRALALCVALSVVGWFALVLAFWFSLRAVSHPVSLGLVAFVLPVGMVAVAVPLPGGVGSVDVALIGLLTAVGGVPSTAATAGVILYRGVTYWLPLLFGGGASVGLTVEARRRRSGPR